jgi:integrase
VIQVRHGKGDKYREAAIVGDETIRALKDWRAAAPSREFVFWALAKGDKLGEDKPMSLRAINKLVDETEKRSGITFKPHDLRRTLATDLLARGYSPADV